MPYSARIESKWKRWVRQIEARMSWPDFHDSARRRLADPGQHRLPPRLRRTFANRKSDEDLAIEGLVDQYRQAQVTKLDVGVFP